MMTVTYKQVVTVFMAVVYLFIAILCMFNSQYASILAAFSGFLCIGMGYASKKPILLMMGMFVSLYFFYLIPYFSFDIAFATRQDYQEHSLSVFTLLCTSVFVSVFFYVVAIKPNQYIDFGSKLKRQSNVVLMILCLAIVVVLASLMVDPRGTSFTLGYREVTEVRYAFIDYALCFILMAFCFSHKKYNKYILAIAFLYCLICILYGYRLRMLQMSMLIYFLFYERKLSINQLFFLCLVAVYSQILLGVARMGLDTQIDIYSAIGINQDGIIVSNQGGVFLNTNMYIGLVQDGLISTSERVQTFLGNFWAIFISQSDLPEGFHLPKIAERYFSIPGGGLISGYLYVWGGLLSIVAGALAIGGLFRLAYGNKHKSQYVFIYLCIIVVGFPRWFAYNPIHFFKMGSWALVIFFVLSLLNQVFRVSSRSLT